MLITSRNSWIIWIWFPVYAFGTYTTGLCLPLNDLDLILISKNPQIKYDENYTKEN